MKRFPHFLLLVLLLLTVEPTRAHGYIVRALPPDRAVLQHPPARLQYWFSESLEPLFSRISLRDQNGAVRAEGAVDPANPNLLSLNVPAHLPDGAYIVDLRPAFASDGHVVVESRVFFVGESASGLAGERSAYNVIPLEVLWRALLYGSTLVLLGLFSLYALVLVPAWGSREYRAGLLPPRIMQRLSWIAGIALGVAVAGNIIAILQQSMAFFSTGALEVISQDLWQVVRIGSRFGDVWTARMVLLGLAALFIFLAREWREEYPANVRAFWTANAWLFALLTGGFSISSHAAGSLILPWVAVLVDWAHTLAVGLWVGGLVTLALILPLALRPYEGEARRLALLAVLRRFSRLVIVALAVIITTGIYSALNWLYQPADLIQTVWGGALLVKLALVSSILLIGGLHYLASNPDRFARWQARLASLPPIVQTLRLEALLALLTLVAVAMLSASAVPEPVLPDESAAPSAEMQLGDLTVRQTISPGGPGLNSFDTLIQSDTISLDEAQIEMQIISPARDWRSAWTELPQAAEALYISASDEIDSEGRWWTLLDITLPGEAPQRAAFEWDINTEAAVTTSLAPGPQNLLTLAGVILSLAWASYPLARRFVRWLDWRPASITIASAVLLATAFLLGVGITAVNQSEAAYQAAINPPPQVVNTVLPDAESLALGRELYIAHCIGWQSYGADFRALKDRLTQARDEDLYTATLEGWRSLPPCEGDLSETERWHIVNFFRTLAE